MIAKFEIHALLIQNRNEERREKVLASPSKNIPGGREGENIPVWIFNTGGCCGYVHAHVCVCLHVCVGVTPENVCGVLAKKTKNNNNNNKKQQQHCCNFEVIAMQLNTLEIYCSI